MPPFFVEDMTESQKAEYFAFLKTVNESKGGQTMGCKHEHLRTVGFQWFCADCGKELNPQELFGEQEQAKNPPAEEQTETHGKENGGEKGRVKEEKQHGQKTG